MNGEDRERANFRWGRFRVGTQAAGVEGQTSAQWPTRHNAVQLERAPELPSK